MQFLLIAIEININYIYIYINYIIYLTVKNPDLNARERFAKAVHIVFEICRQFLFAILLKRKGTIEGLTITLRAIKWDGQLEKHVNHCLLESKRKITKDDFDISMIYFILRNGQVLRSDEVPTKKWGHEPDSNEMTLGDDIERMRKMRNKLCHSPLASMAEDDFDSMVKETKDIMHRWYKEIGFGLLSEVDKIVHSSLTDDDVNNNVDIIITEMKRSTARGTLQVDEMNIQTMVFVISSHLTNTMFM